MDLFIVSIYPSYLMSTHIWHYALNNLRIMYLVIVIKKHLTEDAHVHMERMNTLFMYVHYVYNVG